MNNNFFFFFYWFKLRNLLALCITLVLSFTIIENYFNWDFSIFGDFYMLGF